MKHTATVGDTLRMAAATAKMHLQLAQVHVIMGSVSSPRQKLGDTSTRAGSQVGRKAINYLLDLDGRVTDHRRIHNHVSGHGVTRVGGRLQRVRRDLRVLNANSPPVPLAIGMRDGHPDRAVSRGENPAVGTGAGPRKRNSDRIDSD